jgi:hypothetical protein
MIKPPSPELLKEIAAFSGKWKGKWVTGPDFILVITEIDPEKAETIYAVAEFVGSYASAASCEYITAKVIPGGSPKIEFSRVFRGKAGYAGDTAWCTFEMQKDLKTLKGVLQYPKNTLKATLEKIE